MYKYKGTNIPSRKKKRKIETKSIKIQFNLFLKLRNKSNQIKLEIDWTVVKFNFKLRNARSISERRCRLLVAGISGCPVLSCDQP